MLYRYRSAIRASYTVLLERLQYTSITSLWSCGYRRLSLSVFANRNGRYSDSLLFRARFPYGGTCFRLQQASSYIDLTADIYNFHQHRLREALALCLLPSPHSSKLQHQAPFTSLMIDSPLT